MALLLSARMLTSAPCLPASLPPSLPSSLPLPPVQVEVSRIPSSLTAAQFEARKTELLAVGKTEVVVYCTVGYRSSAYAAKLREQGFDAKNLEGSIVRWVSEPEPGLRRGAALRSRAPAWRPCLPLSLPRFCIWGLCNLQLTGAAASCLPTAAPPCPSPTSCQAQKRYPLVTGGGGGGGGGGSDGSAEQERETKRLHVYGKQWALQPEDYEAVMFKHPFLSSAIKGLRQKLPGWLGGSG